MTRPPFLLAGALLCTLTLFNRPAQAGGTYVESFNTTTSKDPGTTANWDTGAGELKLHAFTPSLVGSYDTPGSAFGVAVAGNLAFVADGPSGLRIVDITNPASPSLVGAYGTPGPAVDVVVAGDLAFVADEEFGLHIIDIEDPASPGLVGTLDLPDYALGVAVDGDVAFVADAFDGLYIIDVSNPASPTIIGGYNTPGIAIRVAVAGNHLFLTDNTFGVQIFDVTNVGSPVLLGTYNSPGEATDIAVAGDLAFLADGSSGLLIVNITNPASPTLVGTYNTPGFANDVAVAGDIAFVADDSFGLQIIDITNPASPTLDGSFNTPGAAFGVAVAGELAFVADEQTGGLQIVKVTDRAFPRQVGFFNPTGTAYRVAAAGDLLFAACDFSGLKIINISNPGSPTLVGTYDTPARAFGVAVAGDLAFVADDTEGLKIIDISNPASPTLVGSLDTPDHAEDVAVAGNLAFVADRFSGLRIIDITNPASPVLKGFYDTAGQSQAVTLAGDLAFVGDAGSVEIINISNPASPSLVVSYDMEGFTRQVAVDGDLAFVADDAFGLKIVDISNPASPSLVATYDTPGIAIGVTVAGDFAFVADQASGLWVLDITTPSSPALVGGYDTFGNAWDIVVAGDVVYLADTFAGLRTIEVFNHRFYTRLDIGQSLNINTTFDVVAARLTSTQTPTVTWEITANGGTNWQSVTPDNAWYPVDIEGYLLRWRSKHALTGWPGANPTVSDLQIEWLYEFATIDAITDIPDDQGGWVRLSATRSGRDFAAETLPISHYGVWRRVDTSPTTAALAPAPRDVSTIDPSIVEAFGALPIFGHGRDVYVESAPGQLTGTLPPGTWALVTSIPALQQQTYLADVPTLADETVEGIEYTVFVVTAHTTTPSVWYAGPTASGYSIDNIAPGVPTGFAVAYNTGSGNTLTWDASQDDDFQYFRVYRSTDPDFTPSPGTLVHATATTGWSDPDYDGWTVYYKITALDYVGNESDPATAGTMSSTDGPRVPTSAALHQNHPNPFNPTTQIRYDVPVGGADVQLAIYDVSGRRVRVLVSGREAAGEKSVRWDARDDAGVSVATGIYFCRVTIGDFAATRKMVLLK